MKKACSFLQAFQLTRQGSNLDSSEPKSDVLPITPRVNHYCLFFKDAAKIGKEYIPTSV